VNAFHVTEALEAGSFGRCAIALVGFYAAQSPVFQLNTKSAGTVTVAWAGCDIAGQGRDLRNLYRPWRVIASIKKPDPGASLLNRGRTGAALGAAMLL